MMVSAHWRMVFRSNVVIKFFLNLISPLKIHPIKILETLAKECNIVLRDYRNSLGENEWNKIARNVVIPRVVNLIQTLPSYAKSGRESDLSSNMQLVSGYLLSFAEDESSDGHSDTISKTMLSKFLFQKLVSNKTVRQCLVGRFLC